MTLLVLGIKVLKGLRRKANTYVAMIQKAGSRPSLTNGLRPGWGPLFSNMSNCGIQSVTFDEDDMLLSFPCGHSSSI
jgi:hypothetical protein